MDRERLFGGNPMAVIVRLVVLSIVVGIVLSALDITPANLFDRARLLIQRISTLGFDAVRGALQYFLIGAVIVVPIWLVVRLLSVGGRGDRGPR